MQNMIDYIFFDTEEEVFLKARPWKDDRFWTIFPNDSDYYEEVWNCDGNMRVGIAYHPEEFYDNTLHEWKFVDLMVRHKVIPVKLAYISVPRDEFDRMCKEINDDKE